MSPTDILDKAVKKAFPDKKIEVVDMSISMNGAWLSYREVIYWQEFARNLWGEEPILEYSHVRKGAIGSLMPPYEIPIWKFHLQMMVIADDPIQYLGEHL